MTNTRVAPTKYVPGSSRGSRTAASLLAQMADLERAQRIKRLRAAVPGLSQPKVADGVGMSLRGYQKVEATGGIGWENAKKLAKFFKVDALYVWSGENAPAPTPDVLGTLEAVDYNPDQLDRIEALLKEVLERLPAAAPADDITPDFEVPGDTPSPDAPTDEPDADDEDDETELG